MIKIDYYSGTNGSKLIAEKIAEKLTNAGKEVSISRINRDEIVKQSLENIEYYILIFPVHSFNAPKPVGEWIESLQGNGCKTAVIAVSGAGEVVTNTATRRKTIKLLEKQNFNVVFENWVRMPNSWMKVPDKKKFTRLLRQLPSKIEEISSAILTNKIFRKKPYWFDIFMSWIGNAEKKITNKFGLGIKRLETCNGCGLCATNCCSSNIKIENGKAVFGSRCDMCLGCLYNCPQKALKATTMAFQVDKKGYVLV